MRSSLYNVMTQEAATKEVLVNFRLKPDVRDEFKVVADLRGSTMSGLLHQYVIKLIREEKERDPVAFTERIAVIQQTTE